MVKIKKSDSFDTEFRGVVLAHICSAKKSIKVRTGEIASYDFLDLRGGAEEAAERGVKAQVYATQPDPKIVNRLVYNGVEVHIGLKDSQEHFMIIDDSKVVISLKKRNRKIPTPMGKHKFQLIEDRKTVKKYIDLFKRLIDSKNSKKQKVEGSDPLKESLKETAPLSYT